MLNISNYQRNADQQWSEWPPLRSLQINAGEGVEKREATVGGNIMWKTRWGFLRKPKAELPYHLASLLLGIYPDNILMQNDSCAPVFTVAVFTVAKTWNRRCGPHIQWTEREGNDAISMTWAQLEIVRLSEVRKRKAGTI